MGILTLAACIPTEATSTTTVTTRPGTSTTSTTSAPSTTLDVWVDRPRYGLVSSAAAGFANAAGVEVDVTVASFEDILAAVAEGDAPDVFVASHEHLGDFLRDGSIQSVELGSVAADLDPVAVAAVTSDGAVYGVPYGMEAVALFVDTDVLGVDVPTPVSFSQIGASGRNVGVPGDPYHGYGFLSASGARLFGPGWSPDDVGLRAGAPGLQALERLVDGGTVVGGDFSDLANRFTAGTLPYLMTGPWEVAPLGDAGVGFTVASLPTVEGMRLRPFVGVQAFFVGAGANPGVAASFVREVLATPDVLAGATAGDDRVPAYLPARTGYPYPAFVDSVDGGDILPSIPEMALVWDPLTSMFDDVYAGLAPGIDETDATIGRLLAP
jgi:arabinogalactan oligomer/maltooligosaccharide transport system substrate-binding protein